MKKVYRFQANDTYWDQRWAKTERDPDTFEDLNIYPVRYAEMIMRDRGQRALEIGCGLGRILKHYNSQGFHVSGIERSRVAVERLRREFPALDVAEGDVLSLPYSNGAFDIVMAFGVFHNLEQGLDEALAETARCLKKNGQFAISMRPNNLEMNLNEVYWRWQSRKKPRGKPQFHKLLVGEREFRDMLAAHGLVTDQIHRARNVSLWYRIPFLRSREDDTASEETRRASGYLLNAVGNLLDGATRRLFPYQTANVIVYIGHKS
jgi:SAM-dependent methyltransferase